MKTSSQLFIVLRSILLLVCFAFTVNAVAVDSVTTGPGYRTATYQDEATIILASNDDYYGKSANHDRDHDSDRHHGRDRHHQHTGSTNCPTDDVISFFDNSVANGMLIGVGHGKSARGRIKALRKMLTAAEHALSKGKVKRANKKLLKAYQHIVGAPHVRVFVTGPAADELASQIMALIQCIKGGSTGDLPPSAQVTNNSNGLLAKVLLGAIEFTENLALCGSGCSTGFIDVAEGSNPISVLPLNETLARQIGALGPFERNTFYAVNIIGSTANYCAELWIRHQTSSTFNDDTTRVLVSSVCEPAAPPSMTLSGTAAAGAAIVGVVTVRDSSVPFQERSAPIGDLGGYSVDVTGMTPPFMLRADGHVGLQSYSIYSAAVEEDILVPGTINITPLTDLIISNIAGQVAAAAYASGDFGSITNASLVAAQADLLAKLTPVLIDLGISTSVDILRATFNADHTGLDLLLDALRIEVDPLLQLAIITNIINGSQTIDNFAALDPSGTLTGGGTGAGLTEVEYIQNVFQLWTDAFAISLPGPGTLLHLFDPAFTYEGISLDAFLTMLTTDPSLVGLNVSNFVALESISTSAYPYTATVTFVPVIGGSQERPMQMQLSKQSATDPWLMTGDGGRVGQAMVISFAEYRPLVANRCPGDPAIKTGLKVEITSPGDLNVDYALIKGPGLPLVGGLWFKVPFDDHFNLAEVGAVYDGASTVHACGDAYYLDDAAISSIPNNSTYTFELWDDASTMVTSDDVMLHTYTENLPVGPALNSSLTLANFPAFDNPDTEISAADAAALGGSFNASWTMPVSLSARYLYFYRSQTGDPQQYKLEQNLLPTATSAGLAGIPAPSGTVTNYGYSLSTGNNANFREYRISINH